MVKNREAIIHILKAYFEKSKYPIEKVWLFGSYARDEAKDGSDIDLMIRFTKPNTIDLWDYAGIMLELEDLIAVKVDLVQEGKLKAFAQATAEQDKIIVYERKAEEQRAVTTHH